MEGKNIMNIFKILSSYDGSINEPNISAFISYLIDPNEDHGLGFWILNGFLKKNETFNLIEESEDELIAKIAHGDYVVKILPEFPVSVTREDKIKHRDIDILIEISKENSEVPVYAVCIENKISKSSITDMEQLVDEMEGLGQLYNLEKQITKIGLIYLIPEYSSKASKAYEKIKGYNKKYMTWKGDDGDSITGLIRNVLCDESSGKIDPIYDTIKYTLRSFISFINNDFESEYQCDTTANGKQFYGKPVIDYLTQIVSKLDENKEYDVKEVKDKLSAIIKKESGKNLPLSTRNCQMYQVIVNDMNRTNYQVKNPDDSKYNLLYYIDENNRTKVKKFNIKDAPSDIRIYHKADGKREFITLDDLRKRESA